MNTIMTTLARSLPLCMACLLGGCANQPTQTEMNFGESVRQMVQAQIYDPRTVTMPSDEAIDGTDGPYLEGAVEAYQNTVSDSGNVGNDIVISVGGGQR
jgi:hypothetical protein